MKWNEQIRRMQSTRKDITNLIIWSVNDSCSLIRTICAFIFVDSIFFIHVSDILDDR